MNEFTSSATSQTASCFEFLLKPTLLDTYLTAENLEIVGTDLIIQFLISANLIEQKTRLRTANENSNDIEPKDNRIRALRHLAMKIAAKLNWDLAVIERRIPVAVASDLIHCFYRLTTQNEPALFAVQLLHRWTVRTCVQASFPTKPLKIFQVNVAGYVNPLQHMREPNENVIQMARAKVRESVQALEALLENKSVIQIPVDACFGLIDSEHGLISCDWSKTEIYPSEEYRARIAFDLGMIYFHEQNYSNALSMFRRVEEIRHEFKSSSYFSSLDGYLASLQLINPQSEQNLHLKIKDRFVLGIPPSRASIEDYISILAEDNQTKEMTIAARLRLEDRLEIGSPQYKVVSAFNLIRFLLDGKHVANLQYAFDYLETALQELKQVTSKQQILLNNFLKIHYRHLNENLQEQIRLGHFAHLIGSTFSIPSRRSRLPVVSQRSFLLERANGSRALKCQTRLLHFNEPEILTQTIKEMDTNELRSTLIELFPLTISPQPIDQTLAIITNTNHLLGEFIRIFYEKAKRNRLEKQYGQSRNLLTHAIDILNAIHHRDLPMNQLAKYLHYERLLVDLYESLSRQIFTDHDNHLWETCQSYLMENHSENDVHLELIAIALAYGLSREKLTFIQSLVPSVQRLRPYFDLAKLFSRLPTNGNPSQLRPELVRDLWDRICEILAEKPLNLPNSQHSRSRLSLIEFEHFIEHLTHPIILQILFSIFARIYSLILVEQSHIEIFLENPRLWPTSLDYRHRSIRCETLGQIITNLFQQIQRLKFLPNSIRSSIYRTQADLHLTVQQNTSAMQFYLTSIAIETNLFTSSSLHQQDDPLIRNLIKATLQLGYHTQVACICQLLSTPDYNIIFKTLQENYINDDIDDYYECIWDLALLEILINNLATRGYEDKKRLAIRICKQKDLNGNNNDDVRLRMTRFRRRLFYKQLLSHYLLTFNRLYSRTRMKSKIHRKFS